MGGGGGWGGGARGGGGAGVWGWGLSFPSWLLPHSQFYFNSLAVFLTITTKFLRGSVCGGGGGGGGGEALSFCLFLSLSLSLAPPPPSRCQSLSINPQPLSIIVRKYSRPLCLLLSPTNSFCNSICLSLGITALICCLFVLICACSIVVHICVCSIARIAPSRPNNNTIIE